MSRPTCSRPKCDRYVYSRDLCGPHYDKARRNRSTPWSVPAGPVLAHLDRLRAQGWTQAQIGAAAGLHQSALSQLLRKQPDTIRATTAAALLAVQPQRRVTRRTVDATGTRRRVQALMWMGWSTVDIAARSGLPVGQVRVLSGRTTVTDRTAAAITDVYRQLADVPGPSRNVAGKARAYGYLPPAAWDDVDSDPEPPAAEPIEDGYVDHVAVQKCLDGRYDGQRLTDTERDLVIVEGQRRGWSIRETAEVTQINASMVIRRRAALRDAEAVTAA